MGTTIGPNLALRQSPALALTPELRQAIRLLQMANLELMEQIEHELELNPLLERVEPAPAAAPERSEPDSDEPEDADAGPADFWPEPSHSPGSGTSAPELPARHSTLRDHLATQIATDVPDPGDRAMALALIEHLDETGYLVADPGELATRLGCGRRRIEILLGRLQQLDPPGVFARSLAECLAAQLADRGLLDAAMERLLQHLVLVGQGELGRLQRLVGIDRAGLRAMLAVLRRLDPKPGLAFESVPTLTVVPDVLMQPRPGGGWTVELNALMLPKLIVNRRYHAELLKGTRLPEARSYLADRLASAKWLVRALDQRARTILKVATEIVRRQDGFFTHGVSRLRPLVLRDVALAVKLHESTVSRATSNKFMATPRGTFELRYFFATGLPARGQGETVTAEAVKSRIRELIHGEPAGEPLADDRLVELLREGGIAIARRTVAKYREALRIPSSMERRRLNALRD
jgi:RNA polymerase sigma-54 factor